MIANRNTIRSSLKRNCQEKPWNSICIHS